MNSGSKPVRHGRGELRSSLWVALAVCASCHCLAAQGAPSADSMQKFLASTARSTATQVHFVDASGRANYVTGKYTGTVKVVKGSVLGTKETVEALPERVVEKQISDMRAAAIEAIDSYGRPNTCATRITEVTAPIYDESKSDADTDNRSFSFKFTYTDQLWSYEPLTKFMSPAQVIDWSAATVRRVSETAVSASSAGQSFAFVHLTYFAATPDQADAIEYAMKFLALSCDGTAASRF